MAAAAGGLAGTRAPGSGGDGGVAGAAAPNAGGTGALGGGAATVAATLAAGLGRSRVCGTGLAGVRMTSASCSIRSDTAASC